MDFRGSTKKLFTSSLGSGGGVSSRDMHCSTTPRNNLLDAAYQIDKVCETTANSFPRQLSRSKCGEGGGAVAGKCLEELQNIPPVVSDEHTPQPPKRSSSLFTPGGASTLTLRHSKSPRECSSSLVNPKRISIATSSFWLDHPDMEKFANALDFGHETMKTHSVWGTSDQGSGGTECVDIWGDPPAVKKGVLMQQREKLWSRWKERYVILTRDYLNCFRRSANIHRSGVTLSEMGSFIFKLRLADVEEIRWENRRSGSLVALVLPQEPRILLRVPNDNTEALHQWYTLLQECIYMSKERRQALRNHHTSTYGKTYSTTKSRRDSCEGGNEEDNDSPTKSQKSSSSPHSSSDEADGARGVLPTRGDLDVRGTTASRRNVASRTSVVSGKFSTTKSNNSNAHANGTTANHRSSVRKYSPVVVGDHDEDDDDDYDDDFVEKFEESLGSGNGRGGSSTGGGTSSSDADDYAPITLRRVSSRGGLFSGSTTRSGGGSNLTLNDFIRNPWKEVSTPEEGEDDGNNHEETSSGEILPAQNGTSPSRRSSNGYAIPVDSLLRPNHQTNGNKRPESWSTGPTVGPQSNLFYRTPSIVPSHWVNKRELPLARAAGGPPFGRSTMIVCPSRLTAEVTYIRRM